MQGWQKHNRAEEGTMHCSPAASAAIATSCLFRGTFLLLKPDQSGSDSSIWSLTGLTAAW